MKVEYDRRSEIPQWKNTIAVGIIGLSAFLSACSETYGYVTQDGARYYGKAPTSWHIKHEECHMEKLVEMGEEEYWDEYWDDIQFAIDEETRCGFPDPLNSHPAIRYRVKIIPPLPQKDAVVFSYPSAR